MYTRNRACDGLPQVSNSGGGPRSSYVPCVPSAEPDAHLRRGFRPASAAKRFVARGGPASRGLLSGPPPASPLVHIRTGACGATTSSALQSLLKKGGRDATASHASRIASEARDRVHRLIDPSAVTAAPADIVVNPLAARARTLLRSATDEYENRLYEALEPCLDEDAKLSRGTALREQIAGWHRSTLKGDALVQAAHAIGSLTDGMAALDALHAALLTEANRVLEEARVAVAAVTLRRELCARLERRLPKEYQANIVAIVQEVPVEQHLHDLRAELFADAEIMKPREVSASAEEMAVEEKADALQKCAGTDTSAQHPSPSAAPEDQSEDSGNPFAAANPLVMQWRNCGASNADVGISSQFMIDDATELEQQYELCMSLAAPPNVTSLEALAFRLSALAATPVFARIFTSLSMALRGRDGESVQLIPPATGKAPATRRVIIADGAARGTGVLADVLCSAAATMRIVSCNSQDFAGLPANRRLAEWLGVAVDDDIMLIPFSRRAAPATASGQPDGVRADGDVPMKAIGVLLVVLPPARLSALKPSNVVALAAVARHLSLALAHQQEAEAQMRPPPRLLNGQTPLLDPRHVVAGSPNRAPSAESSVGLSSLASHLSALMLELDQSQAASLGRLLASCPKLGDQVLGKLVDEGLPEAAADFLGGSRRPNQAR